MNTLLAKVAEAALELLYPKRANCMGCGSPIGADYLWLCADCDELLKPVHDLKKERCGRCGCPGGWDRRKCKTCGDWPDDTIDMARFAYVYKRPVDLMIRRMKYNGVSCLGPWMGEQIANMLSYEAFPPIDLIVPVPMHPKRLQSRGFNHSELIAREVGLQVNMPMENTLVRTRNTRQQARLSYLERAANMDGAFEAVKDLSGRSVLLIDDVLTSGATALHCAKSLKDAGAMSVYVATLSGAVE